MFVILFPLGLLALRFRRICSQQIFSVTMSLIKKLATTRLFDPKGVVCFFKPTINNSPSSFASHLDYTASRTERRFFMPSPSFRLLSLFYTFSILFFFIPFPSIKYHSILILITLLILMSMSTIFDIF